MIRQLHSVSQPDSEIAALADDGRGEVTGFEGKLGLCCCLVAPELWTTGKGASPIVAFSHVHSVHLYKTLKTHNL